MKKLKFNKNILIPISIVFSIWILGLSWMIYENKNIGITKYEISNKKIPKVFQGFKIAQLSDYHNGTFSKNNDKFIQKLKECNPNIIVITGDFFDGKDKDFSLCFDFIEKITKIFPVYYVTGNHEKSIKNYQELKQKLESYGVVVLEEESISIEKEKESISLIGIQDLNFYKQRDFSSVTNRIKNLINTDTYNVLLSHRPERFEEYVASEIDLVLTGHAHGGQFRFPFIGGIYAPHQGFFPKYDAGLYVENNTTMIVNRGLGQSSIPLRFNNSPEIVLVELQR